tara:strand:- start:210 stop:569 length:360 start_codon:yes stop_codon:yes gene_type:complete
VHRAVLPEELTPEQGIDPQVYVVQDKKVQIVYRLGPNHTCEMIDISSKERGKGNGTIVYQNFEKTVQEEFNIRNIYAFTRESNTDAIRWYKRIGFTATIIPNMYSDEPTKAAVILTKEL